MSEPAQAGKTCDLRGIREAVCVHTGKITDSCLAKDCIEDLRVYLTVAFIAFAQNLYLSEYGITTVNIIYTF